MNFEDVQKFIQLAKDQGVSELKYDDGKKKFHVVLGGQKVSYVADPVTNRPQISNEFSEKKTPVKEEGIVEVISPFVGTFYAQANPDASPYVQVGDKIGKGQPLCIVEAMKIMNEIESEVNGTIVEICVESENYVEFGQVLFKIKV